MKKFILILSVFGIVSCTNPSMEDGLAGLNDALAELAAAIESLNIAQMQADLAQMNADAAQMVADVENAQGSWDDAITQLSAISETLSGLVATSETWATSDQMQDLLEDVIEFEDGVDQLVLRADYDHDGVINALDKCPDTPLKDINNVDVQGCAPGETPETDD